MENFALIALVAELRPLTVGMSVRRIARFFGPVFSLETRSGKMPGIRISLNPRSPSIRVPGPVAFQNTLTDDFVMVLRKHLIAARLLGIEKPLSERVVELRFRTALPMDELAEVFLVAELIPNAPNLLLLDASRRVLATALPTARGRDLTLYEPYAYPPGSKVPMETILGSERSWFDAEAFADNPVKWLISDLGGMGPVLAGEITVRARTWARAGAFGIPDGIRNLVLSLQDRSPTAWVYTSRPLSVIVDEGDTRALEHAIVSPIELESMRTAQSFQTFPGMVAALRAVADPLESLVVLDRARARELKRLRRDMKKVEMRRTRLVERKRRFEDASSLQTTAQLLASSGADMDRHHAFVKVTEYTETGSHSRSVAVDPSRTLRDNINRMFRQHQKARRGLERIERQLSRARQDEDSLRQDEDRLHDITHWDAWLADGRNTARKQRATSPAPSSRRRRAIVLDGYEILVGRNSRENDEVTFRVASADDFWLHVADYSGSHVVVRNPKGTPELDRNVLVRAAQLAAYHSQARNSSRVEVHYTQRKFVSKPKKAAPGLVRLRQFKSIVVEPRDWTQVRNTPEPAQEAGR